MAFFTLRPGFSIADLFVVRDVVASKALDLRYLDFFSFDLVKSQITYFIVQHRRIYLLAMVCLQRFSYLHIKSKDFIEKPESFNVGFKVKLRFTNPGFGINELIIASFDT